MINPLTPNQSPEGQFCYVTNPLGNAPHAISHYLSIEIRLKGWITKSPTLDV